MDLRLVLALLAAAVAPAAAQQPLRVQRAEIIDRQGFDKPLVAATVFVPAGWRTQGTVVWKPGERCSSAHATVFTSTAPDDSAAIELAAGEGWGANNSGAPNDCPTADIADPQRYLQAWVQRHRPGARWLDYRPRPDKSRPPQQSTWAGGGTWLAIESGQALIGYGRNGRDTRETLVVITSIVQSRFNVGGRALTSLQGQSHGVLAWRAPHGSLDFRHFDAVWASLQPGPEWKARIDAAHAQMAAENDATQRKIAQIRADTQRETMAHIARRGQIMAQTRQEIADMRNNTWQNTQATNDRMQRDTTRTLREVQGYREPRGGGVVELSSHYHHAWQLRDGSYVLTDDPNFDPQRALGIGGEQLQRTK